MILNNFLKTGQFKIRNSSEKQPPRARLFRYFCYESQKERLTKVTNCIYYTGPKAVAGPSAHSILLYIPFYPMPIRTISYYSTPN